MMFSLPSKQPAMLATLALLGTCWAHTTMTTLFVNGVNQGDGVCIRMNNNAATTNTYINPVTSKDMACGIGGEIGGARVCPANASSILTFEFREQAPDVNSVSIAPSHKGPAAVYLKKVDSANASNNAAGDGWFKIWESVYDESVSEWGTTKMINNNGHISVRVPQDIVGGYYLARTELLALHAASENPPDPQFYVGCAQLFIESEGTALPPTVTIAENTYSLNMPALTYNIYTTPLSLPYQMYGPAVYKPGSATSQTNSASSLVQTEGFKPEGCIFVNGNWCGYEVPSYTDENSCWASSNNCWAQSNACWNETQPTGLNFCKIWQAKCQNIQDGCQSGAYSGPPNKGQDITPAWPALVGSTDIFT